MRFWPIIRKLRISTIYIKLPLITTKPAQASVHLPVDIVHLTGMVGVELKRLRAVRVHVHLTVGHVGH